MATPKFYYSHPTTPAGTGFITDLGDVVPWGTISGLTTVAAAGEVGQSTIYLNDPEGTLNIVGLNRFRFEEDDAPAGNEMVWNGYINSQTITRLGPIEKHSTGMARSWELSLSDDNAVLAFRVITGSDGNRPAESGSARLAWLISSEFLGGVEDQGYVEYPATMLDAADYRGQWGKDVLADIALQCGNYNYFAQYNMHMAAGTSNPIELWFGDSNTSTAYSSTALISNDPSDGGSAYFPSDDTTLVRDPSRLAAGVYLPYNGGTYYGRDLDTSYAYGYRDQVAPMASVSSATQASALATEFLARFDNQDEKISTRIWVPAANVNDIRAGMRVQVKFTHLPGWSDIFRWARVTQRTISNFATSTSVYEIGLELSRCAVCEGSTDHALNSEGATWTSSYYTGPLGTGLYDVIADDQRWWGSETGYGSPSDLGDGSASTWCGFPDTLVYQNSGPHVVSLHCDLGSAKTIDELQIHELEHDTGGWQFTLWSSTDDTNWTERVGPFGPVNNGEENYYPLGTAVTARYWRITGVVSVGDTRVGPWEPLYDIRWYRVSLWGCVAE